MKEGGIEGREGILGGSPALSIERITALCSREIHPPVRAGQPLPGPGGEVLRWARRSAPLLHRSHDKRYLEKIKSGKVIGGQFDSE